MTVALIHATPLHVAMRAIRKCWNSEDKSDSEVHIIEAKNSFDSYLFVECGIKDRALIERIGNKMKHESVKNHINYTFDIDGVSTKTLLAMTRHDVGTEFSVQSTRYTTKKRKDELSYTSLSKPERNEKLDRIMDIVQEAIDDNWNNDDIAMLLPQAYNYSWIATMSMSALQHFLALRTSGDAHYDIRELAFKLYKQIPEDHKYMFKDYVKEEK